MTLLIRVGGTCLIAFVPLLVVGSVLYSRVRVNSGSGGDEALRRIADAGPSFAVMNAFFHLGTLLLIPGGVGLALALRGEDRDGWLLAAALFLALAVLVPSGFVFSLNHGLYRLAGSSVSAPEAQRTAYTVAAEVNLRMQAGAELVQSLGVGLWLLFMVVAAGLAGWPTWLVGIGAAGGLGFIAAGFASVLQGGIWRVLGIVGSLGLLLFAIWIVGAGIRLLTFEAG